MNYKKAQMKNMIKRVIYTGLSGGFIFVNLSFLIYIFNFIEISPTSIFVRIWCHSPWTYTWLGDLAALFIGSVLSTLIALVYYLLLRKVHFYPLGILFGIFLWMLMTFVIQPFIPNIPKMTSLRDDTSFTLLLLLILYGTFISYSISFDYDETMRSQYKRF